MPANSTTSAVARQWSLLEQLPTRLPGISCAELVGRLAQRGYHVSKRTIERDLNDLSHHFPLQCNDKGTPYGWYWTPSSTGHIPGMSLSEALALQLAESSLKPLLTPTLLQTLLEARLLQARQKLNGLNADSSGIRWQAKIASSDSGFHLIAPVQSPVVADSIHSALLTERQIRGQYCWAHSEKTSEVILNPLALLQRGSLTFLLATDREYAAIQHFATHRFSQVQVLDSPAIGLEHFNLQRYLAETSNPGSENTTIVLHAWVNHHLGRKLKETPLASNMRLSPENDGYRLQATVDNNEHLHEWLLAQAGALVVLEPTQLKELLMQRLQKALEHYEKQKSLIGA